MNRIRNVFKLLLPVLCLLAGSCGYQLGGTKPPKLGICADRQGLPLCQQLPGTPRRHAGDRRAGG